MEVRTPARETSLATTAHVSPFNGVFGEYVRRPSARKKYGIHQGWDLYARPGTPVFAITGGTIIHVYATLGDYGRTVVLKLDRTNLYALYAHLASSFVKQTQPPQHVHEGQVLAVTGTSGNAAGEPPHLHFAIMITPEPHHGLANFLDPGHVLGYRYRGLSLDDHFRLDVG